MIAVLVMIPIRSSLSGAISLTMAARFTERDPRRSSRLLRILLAGAVSLPIGPASLILQPSATLAADEEVSPRETSDNEQALAQYADAANFQNNGELELAIEAWQKFLSEFADDPLAPRAAHYLGVCYMQLPNPNYSAAAKAFERALQEKEYELREESLSNLGWCYYAAGTQAEPVDKELLGTSIEAYRRLLSEHPASRYADRALFYTGEAHYALDQPGEALKFYDRLLKSSAGKESPLRCDAMYARGLALEDLQQHDQAVAAYRAMLQSCADDPLAPAVRLQLADVLVLQEKYAEAEELFREAIRAGGPEQARSIYRRAFVLTQMDRAAEAAEVYESLIEEFPDSPYAASALLAAAQSYYRAGQMDEASKRFRQVVEAQADRPAATEAAHWLSVMALRDGDVQRAEQIAREQIAKGIEGPYATMLRLDAAEALSMQPDKLQEALAEFEQILEDAPDDPLVPRTLYNAAFTALQLGQPDKTLSFTSDFLKRFENDPLRPDMRYIAAEAHMMAGQPAKAASQYAELLNTTDEHPQRPLWVLRAGTTALVAGQHDQAIEQLRSELDSLPQPPQKAEAHYLIGSSYLASERPAEAVDAFNRALEVDPAWPRTAELLLRLGMAQRTVGDGEAAEATWGRVIDEFPDSPLADQARYQLAQQASDAGEYEQAVELYTELVGEGAPPALRPFALYGRGWALLQLKEYQQALEPLGEVLSEHADHSLADDARLARGIALRRLGNNEEASEQLQAALQQNPQGDQLGHALYELALIDRDQKRPAEAAEKLQRVLNEVPEYPAAREVLYELAWALKEAGEGAAAAKRFAEFATRYPEAEQAGEASYFVAQHYYGQKNWDKAAEAYRAAIQRSDDAELREKAYYRLGWVHYQNEDYATAAKTFSEQLQLVADGALRLDGLMMIGESHFKAANYEAALGAYEQARQWILENDGEDREFSDPAEQRVRELVFLHGGQSAGQLERWEEALRWYAQLRERYPDSSYLPQVFYETGFAHQQLGNDEEALKFYGEVANNFRNEVAARARFMRGEIYFKRQDLARAIPEFKRVMYGYGAEKAPEAIRDWQAKSGFEAGRCAELLIQSNQGERRQQAIELAKNYYQFVTDGHGDHPLASKARERIDALERLGD